MKHLSVKRPDLHPSGLDNPAKRDYERRQRRATEQPAPAAFPVLAGHCKANEVVILKAQYDALLSSHAGLVGALTDLDNAIGHADDSGIPINANHPACLTARAALKAANAGQPPVTPPNLLPALRLARNTLTALAHNAGDVEEWNEGGHAYEACRIIDKALES